MTTWARYGGAYWAYILNPGDSRHDRPRMSGCGYGGVVDPDVDDDKVFGRAPVFTTEEKARAYGKRHEMKGTLSRVIWVFDGCLKWADDTADGEIPDNDILDEEEASPVILEAARDE